MEKKLSKHPPKYVKFDVMSPDGEKYICTISYPAPPLYPLFPIDAKDLFEYIFLQRPSLKNKEFILYRS